MQEEQTQKGVPANSDVTAVWNYHAATNHSWRSVYQSPHYMDWDNQPRPFKIYTAVEGLKLPSDLGSSGVALLDSLCDAPMGDRKPLTLQALAALFYYSAGITKMINLSGGQMPFRAAACTGALYHIELYLVCRDLPGLKAGVYHFGAHDFALRCLRQGDYRAVLVEASSREHSVAQASAVIVTTSVYWRNSWKYQARAYRHCYWDSGTILANLLAMGNARKIPLKVVGAFVDDAVNQLLDLDDRREVAVQLVAVGEDSQQSASPPVGVEFLGLELDPYSRREVDYPAIREVHAASSLNSPQEVRELWGGQPSSANTEPQGQLFPLVCPQLEELPRDTIEEVIQRRGSSRRFPRSPISYSQLSTMLDRAARNIPADFLTGPPTARPELVEGPKLPRRLNQLYLIINDVEGLPAGSYVFRPERGALEQLQAGDFRDQAGRLDLGQELAADASVNIYFLTDLRAVLDRYGNRGYRMAQMEASIMGGRLYLAAYALGLGATGLTFFDEEVTEFFSPHALGKSVMFLVALGQSRRRRSR